MKILISICQFKYERIYENLEIIKFKGAKVLRRSLIFRVGGKNIIK